MIKDDDMLFEETTSLSFAFNMFVLPISIDF